MRTIPKLDWIADGIWPLIRAKERVNVREYAERERVLTNAGGGHTGRWDAEIAPYLNEPMECLNSFDFQTVCVVGPGQCGKTTIAENWLLWSVGVDPGNLLWYMQTDDTKDSYVKTRINGIVQAHPQLADNIGTKPSDDSMDLKRFKTMHAEFLTASASNLINKSAPRIVVDEIDAYDPSLGNVMAQIDVRRQTFGMQSKVLAISHPDLARGMVPEKHWTSGIMSIYADSDQRVGYWSCPHCAAWSSPNPNSDRYMPFDYDETQTLDEIQENTHLACPVNGCLIDEKERRAMIRNGVKWIGLGQTIDEEGNVTGELVKKRIAGFWLVGAMSPFLLDGMGGLARARVKAEREYEQGGDEATLRQVMVKQWGFPYERPRQVGSVSADELAERSKPKLKLKVVPPDVRFLTAMIDCQAKHFDVLVRGWGERGESWVIDRFKVTGLPASNPDDWDKLIDDVIIAAYPLDGRADKLMPIRGVGYDSQGQPGVARQAGDAWLRWRRDRHVRPFGTVAGREVWSVIPMKGASNINSQRLTVGYPDTSGRKDRRASRGNVPMAIFNPNQFKDDVMGQLSRGDRGPWAVHFPAALRSKEPPHEFFEELVAEERGKLGRWEKIAAGSRNESLDLMVGTHVIASLHGIQLIDWRSPPSWAAPWDENGFLVDAESVAYSSKKHNNAPQPTPTSGVRVIVKKDTKKGSGLSKLPR